jgi:LysR family hydrogen peroxide-inducible transcriptional activator
MEMHQLRYLEAVARCGSMMAAAAHCHVSQPALSVQIRKLEEEIGAPLLLRGARGATLTPAGVRSLVTARRILREVEQLRSDARRRGFRERTIVRIAVQPYLATELLPRLSGEPGFAGPDSYQLQFNERTPARVVEAVTGGGADLGLLDLLAVPHGELATEEFVRFPYACFCREDHPLAAKRGIRLAQLLEHSLLLFEHSPGLLARLQSLARRKGRDLEVPFSSDMASTVFEFVASGAGAAVLPASFAARARRRHVVMRPLADYEGKIAVGAIWRPDSPPAAPAQNVLEALRRRAASWNLAVNRSR